MSQALERTVSLGVCSLFKQSVQSVGGTHASGRTSQRNLEALEHDSAARDGDAAPLIQPINDRASRVERTNGDRLADVDHLPVVLE